MISRGIQSINQPLHNRWLGSEGIDTYKDRELDESLDVSIRVRERGSGLLEGNQLSLDLGRSLQGQATSQTELG